jgi:hypothetical protein
MNDKSELTPSLPLQTRRQDQTLRAAYLAMLGQWDTANKWDYPMSDACDGRFHHLIQTQGQFQALEEQFRDELETTHMISLDFENRTWTPRLRSSTKMDSPG